MAVQFFNPPINPESPQLLNLQQETQPLPQYSALQNYFNPLNNSNAVEVQRNLLNLKTAYRNDEFDKNAYAEYLQNGTDAQKQNAQDKINFLTARQNEIAKRADMIRNTAKELGIDTRGFGADNTLEESRQAMYNNDARAMQSLLNLPSVQEMQDEYYQAMRSQGLSHRLARKAAEQMHDKFRQNNIGQLMNGLSSYGINEDGTLNRNGVAMLGKLMYESPQMVELFTNQFASPKNAYAEMNTNQRLAEELYGQEFLKEAQLRSAQEIAAADRAAQDAREAAKMQNNNAKWKYEQERADREFQLKLQKYYDSFNNPEKQKNEAELQNVIDNRLTIIKDFLGKNKFKEAQEMIDSYREKLFSDEWKYAEQVDGEQLERLLGILDNYEKIAKGEITLDELKKVLQGQSPDNSSVDNTESNQNSSEESVSPQPKYPVVSQGQPFNYMGQRVYRNPNPSYQHFEYNGNTGIYGIPLRVKY